MKKLISLFVICLVLLSISIGCRNPFENVTESTLIGKVKDKNGKPVVGAVVTTDPIFVIKRTDIEGAYIISDIPIGKYILRISQPGYRTSQDTVEIRDEFYSCEGGFTKKDVILEEQAEGEKTGEIIGKVQDGDSNAISRTKIVTDPATKEVITDKNGIFVIPEVKAGIYNIKASKEGYKSDIEYELKVDAGWRAGEYLKIVLYLSSQLGSIKGRVTEWSGEGVKEATITTQPEVKTITDASGNYSINGIIPGYYYTIYISKTGYYTEEKDVKVKGKESVTADITLYKYAYNFILKWGSYGSGDGQFYSPEGIAIDGSGNVYVVDSSNDRIQKFSSDGTFISKWGNRGSGDGQFYSPEGIAVDNSGDVYIVDSYNHRIQKFSSTGTFILKWGSSGSGDGQFQYPGGISVDNSGNVYIVDSRNDRIQKFNSTGTFISKWGGYGSRDGEFSKPYGITEDASGNIFITDRGNHRIQKFSSIGMFISKFGEYKTYDQAGIAIDGSGNIYVTITNYYNSKILKFNSKGILIAKRGGYGINDGDLIWPGGIAIDNSGDIYVVDSGNNRIQKLSPGN